MGEQPPGVGSPMDVPPLGSAPQVTQVDRGLLKFVKLEELVLSANRIKEVDATNLPPTLKVQHPTSPDLNRPHAAGQGSWVPSPNTGL